MHRLSLEDLLDHFDVENINLNRRQMEALINAFEPDTSDLISMEESVKDYIINHMFNKSQREKYDSKHNDFVFANIVMSCIL